MKIAKKVQTLLCDDVRQEVGNKLSLMGVFSKDIVVNQLPTTLLSMNLVVMLEGIKETCSELYISLIMPNSAAVNFSMPAPPDYEVGKDLNIVIGIAPFKIQSKGTAKFEIRFAKDEKPSIIHQFAIKTAEHI